jgi:hypothetical protein
MRRVFLMAASLLAAALPVQGADYFQQFHHTTINVKLDAARKWVSGKETILYVNNSPDTLREFYLHLYPNAFKSKNSAYMKDKNRQYNLVLRDLSKEDKGWLDIKNVQINGKKVEPLIDDTIAKMALPAPLVPGDSLRVELEFDGKIHAPWIAPVIAAIISTWRSGIPSRRVRIISLQSVKNRVQRLIRAFAVFAFAQVLAAEESSPLVLQSTVSSAWRGGALRPRGLR